MPLFRSMVAKELLANYNLTQTQTAELLGTSQAAVSQYLNSKRANKALQNFSYMLPKIRAMASYTAQQLTKKETTWKDINRNFCNICSDLLDDDNSKQADNYNI